MDQIQGIEMLQGCCEAGSTKGPRMEKHGAPVEGSRDSKESRRPGLPKGPVLWQVWSSALPGETGRAGGFLCIMQVMEVLGPSLMDLMEWVGGSFSLPTVLHIGLQVLLKPSGTGAIDWNLYFKVLVRLEHLHEAGAVHRWRQSLVHMQTFVGI